MLISHAMRRWLAVAAFPLLAIGLLRESFLAPSFWGILLMGLGFFLGWLGRPRLVRHSPLTLPILILVVLATFSLVMITADPVETRQATHWLWASVAAFYLSYGYAASPSRYRLITTGLIGLGVGLSFLTPFVVDWQQTHLPFIPSPRYAQWPTIMADGVHPNTMASALLLLFPLPLAGVLNDWHTRPWPFWPKLLSALIMGTGLLMTQSRAGYLAVACGCISLFWLSGWRRASYLLTTILLLSLLAISWWGWVRPPASGILTTAIDQNTLAFRQLVWQQALQIIRDFPLTGVGMGAFNNVSERLYPFPVLTDRGTHNLYLQIAADMGLPALVAYLALWGNVWCMAGQAERAFQKQRAAEQRVLVIGLWSGLSGLHLHALLDNTLWLTRIAFLPWLLIGLITALYIHSRRMP